MNIKKLLTIFNFNFDKKKENPCVDLSDDMNQYRHLSRFILKDYDKKDLSFLNPKVVLNDHNIPILNYALEKTRLIQESLLFLEKCGINFQICVFGGFPRDILLNKKINDIDIFICMKIPHNIHTFNELNVILTDDMKKELNFENFKNLIHSQSDDLKDFLSKFSVKLLTKILNKKLKQEKIIGMEIIDREKSEIINDGYSLLFLENSLNGIIKINSDINIDIAVSDKTMHHVMENIDFSLSKSYFNFYETNFHQPPKNIQEFLFSFWAGHEFFSNIKYKTLTLNPSYMTIRQIEKSVDERIDKMREKFPDYELKIIGSNKEKIDSFQSLLDEHDINKEIKLVQSKPSNKGRKL